MQLREDIELCGFLALGGELDPDPSSSSVRRMVINPSQEMERGVKDLVKDGNKIYTHFKAKERPPC